MTLDQIAQYFAAALAAGIGLGLLAAVTRVRR